MRITLTATDRMLLDVVLDCFMCKEEAVAEDEMLDLSASCAATERLWRTPEIACRLCRGQEGAVKLRYH